MPQGRLWHIFDDHLAQSDIHRRLVEKRLLPRRAKPWTIKCAALRLSALNWGFSLQAQPDAASKLVAFVFAFEHLEIATYQQLVRVAARAGDDYTLRTLQCILIDEQTAAAALRRSFDAALDASLDARAVSQGHRGLSINALIQGLERS